MFWDLLFWAGLIVSIAIGFLYFRDLGDISQMVLKVKRENMVRFIRNEYKLIAVGLGAAAVMAIAHLIFGGGPAWVFWIAILVIAFLHAFPYVWVHVGLRNQKNSATYVSNKEARAWVSPSNEVIVIEKDGVARAHPDSQIMRPHLAGNPAGLAGENVIMTYCAMANLGIGYTPEVEGKALDLEVLAQHGNNLILRDNATGAPIQQIYGCPENPANKGQGMKPWPTFRMTFRGFEKAYPEGQVFINKPSANPVLRLFDMFTETMFSAGIARQHREAAPVMDNMSHHDDRLPNKTYVWGINIGGDAVCFTDDFIALHDGPVNTVIGGRTIVLAYDRVYESIGAWYNDGDNPVTQIDFFGQSNNGPLKRVEFLKPGMFWHVWAEFYPNTDINRVAAEQEQAA